MRVLCLVLIAGVVACNAAPGAANQEDGKVELFSGVTIQRYVNAISYLVHKAVICSVYLFYC